MYKKEFNEYFVGLDIGTESVGFAVTDENYNILKFNGKAMWGTRLFDEAGTAEERRIFRSATRRNERRKKRVKLLQEIFAEEIFKVDRDFYIRLEDSKYHFEDKLSGSKYSLFDGEDFEGKIFTDIDYHHKYPTIYHLRKALIENKEKVDIRLIYLAIAHILKSRGHFLFEGENFEDASSFKHAFEQVKNALTDELELEIYCKDDEILEKVLKSRNINITNKKKELKILLEIVNDGDKAKAKQLEAIIALLSGSKAKLANLFASDEFEDSEIKEVEFTNGKFDENENKLTDILNERIVIIKNIKALYDWAVLADILRSEKYISFAKVKEYDTYKDELKILKKMVKTLGKDAYNKAFNNKELKDNYVAYESCSQEDVNKYFTKLLAGYMPLHAEEEDIVEKLKNNRLLTKQVNKGNSTIPYQLHRDELTSILKNAEKDYPFLAEIDSTKFSNTEKIEKIMTFRIPYYVGPLNNAHQNSDDITKGYSWIVKKSDEKIRPWNFEEVVDVDASAEKFITRMTNKCTYLVGEDVIPKDSLLYAEYTVLNEINNLKLFGEKISVELKQQIFEELYKKYKKVTRKKLVSFLITENILTKDQAKEEGVISGIDIELKSQLTAYNELRNIFDVEKYYDQAEEIITSIVLFGDDKKLLIKRLTERYSEILSQKEIENISKVKLTGWGAFSREFLTKVYGVDKESGTGELKSIIATLRDNNLNLMHLLSQNFTYLEAIRDYNSGISEDTKLSYDLVEKLYVSPKVKRPIWQSLQIIEEIAKITKKQPKKIFIEVAKGEEEKKRTVSRKDALIALYKNCKDESKSQWIEKLENIKDDSILRSDQLYLYYTQMGRCMYSGKTIKLENLFDKNIYDVDHIYPRSKTKDDSLNNRVLVLKTENAIKGDSYPLSDNIRNKQNGYWRALESAGFITKEKLNRLTRNSELSPDELASFINRQLVETRQSTKAVAEILKTVFDDSDIVYVKAGNVSDFRHKYDLIKVRDINDYHHAKDAYLNIVVGNVYDVKFTKNPANFIKSGDVYSLNKVFEFDVQRGPVVAWQKGEAGSISTVKKTMSKNNILFTRYAYTQKGSIADLQIVKKGSGQLPIKSSDKRLLGQSKEDIINKYGGYNKVSGAYFTLVEHTVKKKRVQSFEPVYVYASSSIEKDPANLNKYLLEDLGLVEPKVIVKKIKIKTLLDINGFRGHISGRSGDAILLSGAMQLVMSKEDEKYIKKLCKFAERKKEAAKFKKELNIVAKDGITKEENIKLYQIYLDKLVNTKYHEKLSSAYDNMLKKQEYFNNLNIEDQSILLVNALQLFKCNRVLTNLGLIKETSFAGNTKIVKKLDPKIKIAMINQSVTGLFEQRLELN